VCGAHCVWQEQGWQAGEPAYHEQHQVRSRGPFLHCQLTGTGDLWSADPWRWSSHSKTGCEAVQPRAPCSHHGKHTHREGQSKDHPSPYSLQVKTTSSRSAGAGSEMWGYALVSHHGEHTRPLGLAHPSLYTARRRLHAVVVAVLLVVRRARVSCSGGTRRGARGHEAGGVHHRREQHPRRTRCPPPVRGGGGGGGEQRHTQRIQQDTLRGVRQVQPPLARVDSAPLRTSAR
jgi:hypothetical protein